MNYSLYLNNYYSLYLNNYASTSTLYNKIPNGPVAYNLRYFNNMQIKCDVTSVVLFAAILHRLCMAFNGESDGF